MLKMRTDPEVSAITASSEDADEPPSGSRITVSYDNLSASAPEKPGLLSRIKYLFTGTPEKSDNGLREAIEEYIVEPESFTTDSVSLHERVLLSNILKLRDITVLNVMIPRADIRAIEANISKQELFEFLSETQVSRFPVYNDTLDNVVGTVHVKDIMTAIAKGEALNIVDLVSDVPIVSPSMPILDLVLKMRHSRRHMALVVDEYGGIDGLVTIGDVIEAIIGEIEDEHDTQSDPQMIEVAEGSIVADARVNLNEFEDRYGQILDEEEREESDTLGGLVFDLAGRVPARGEMITHPSGMLFEVLEADPRRISRLKITNIPESSALASKQE